MNLFFTFLILVYFCVFHSMKGTLPYTCRMVEAWKSAQKFVHPCTEKCACRCF